MSEFRVTTEGIAATASRLGTVSSGMTEAGGRLSACSGAASGTMLDSALEDLLSRWGQVMPQYAQAGGHLHRAVGGAGHAYAGTDAAIAEAAAGGAGR